MKRPDYQQPLPPMLLSNPEQGESVLRRSEQDEDPGALTSRLIDHALENARISNAEAAYLLGISESMVAKMRSVNSREGISFIQIVKLGPVFVWELHKAMHRKFGFGKRALGELLEAVGLVSVNQ